ncbi:helix-turn-helix transcriptional regulator [Mycolicibacterium sphagni]|uniref:helix-turn-helix transcriptional regulator n=1 Tax=Mycolicibacterium sphagni TaxID=1786 RepID=UPI0013FD6E5E|nr:helix-turn-helix transcriptional regulator [Mycolicibacterium sphagni]
MTAPDPSVLAAVENQQYARELREKLPPEAADLSINNLARRRTAHESWEKRFGEVVRGWRLDRNWSQEDVVEKLRYEGFEMHQTTVAKIERGTRPLRVAEATALAEVFGMPVMAVFELSLPGDAPWWAPEGQSETVRRRQEILDKARQESDDARDRLYSSAQDYAYWLGQVEKVVLSMNEEGAEEVRDDSEA